MYVLMQYICKNAFYVCVCCVDPHHTMPLPLHCAACSVAECIPPHLAMPKRLEGVEKAVKGFQDHYANMVKCLLSWYSYSMWAHLFVLWIHEYICENLCDTLYVYRKCKN